MTRRESRGNRLSLINRPYTLVVSQLLLSVIGFAWVIGLHIFVLQKIDALDTVFNNERSRLMLAEQVNLRLARLESKFYEMATTVGPKRQMAIKAEAKSHIVEIRKILDVLDKGGTYTDIKQVNLESAEQVANPITYRRDENASRFVLEVIDLSPKLSQIDERLDEIAKLVAEREWLHAAGNETEYLALVERVKQALKRIPPVFLRMQENTNRIHASTILKFQEIDKETAERKQYYKLAEAGITLVSLLLVLIIGIAISRRVGQTNEQLCHAKERMEELRDEALEAERRNGVLNEILRLANQDLPLKEMLERALEKIVTVPWLSVESQGSIFLADEETQTLELVADHQLEPQLQHLCRKLAYGQCLCGRVASSGEAVFASHLDDRPEITFQGLHDHGHICMPIKSSGRLVGVLNLYVAADFDRANINEEFLATVSNTLAAIIERKHAEVTLIKLSHAVEQSPAAVLVSDRHGIIEYVNPMFCEKSGYTENEVIGQHTRMLKSGETPEPVYEELWQTITRGRTWRGEFVSRRKNGGRYWESVAISPIRDSHGVTTHYVAIKEDISERKLFEKQLNLAREAAEQANRAKGDFLANMSHEIRTPMNAIIGLGHLALQTDLTDKQHDYLTKIQASATSLLRIINDILDVSKIESGKLVVEVAPFSLERVLDHVRAINGQRATDKDLELIVTRAPDVPDKLRGDAVRLGQVLTNLVNNAVKFTKQGKIEVSVGVESADEQEAKLRFAVTDTGIGITSEQIKRLFKAFSQADASTTRKYGGSGLGLAISQNLVKLMGGTISVDSTPDEGTTFAFTLPFGRAEGEELVEVPAGPDAALPGADIFAAGSRDEASPGGARPMRGAKVLLVEDNEINMQVARELLEGHGLAVTGANNGAEALRALERAPFDLVLMDVQMPEMDGYQATRQIREDPQLAKLPVIALTAHAMESERAKCLAAGMDGYLAKPIDPDKLLETLDEWIDAAEPPAAAGGEAAAAFDKAATSAQRLPGLDIAAGLRSVSGNNELYLRLLQTFLRDHADDAAAIGENITAGNLEDAMRQAHTQKSVAGSLGAGALSAAAKDLETCLRNKDRPGAEAAIGPFAERLAQVIEGLRAELPPVSETSPTSGGEAFDERKIVDLLEKLGTLVGEHDVEAFDVADEIGALLQGTLLAAEFSEVRKRLDAFDFDAAGETLDRLRVAQESKVKA
jgi:PAS domain S-box-containing protein